MVFTDIHDSSGAYYEYLRGDNTFARKATEQPQYFQEEPAITTDYPTNAAEELTDSEAKFLDGGDEHAGTHEEPISTEEMPTDIEKHSGAEGASGAKRVFTGVKEQANAEAAPHDTVVVKYLPPTSRPTKTTAQHSSSVSRLTDGASDVNHAVKPDDDETPVRRSPRLLKTSATTDPNRINKPSATGKAERKAMDKDNISKKRAKASGQIRKSASSDTAIDPSNDFPQASRSSAVKRKASELEAGMMAETKGPITRARKKRISDESIRSAELSFQE